MKSLNNLPALQPLESRMMMSGSTLSEVFSAAQAVNLETNQQAAVQGTLLDGTWDVYQITMPAKGKLSMTLAGEGDGATPLLRLYSSSGRLIRRGKLDASDGDRLLKMAMKPGRTYYVLAGASNRPGGSYNLTLTNTATDDYGNTNETAKRISTGSTGKARISGTVNYGGDVDVFALTATKTGTMQVKLDAGKRSSLDTLMSIYDSQGQLIGQDDDSGTGTNSLLSLSVVSGQTYYVKAAGYGQSTGTYVLNAAITTATPVAPDPEPEPEPAPAPQPEPGQDTPVPGTVVTGQILSTLSGLRLLITGTNNNDMITLSQGGGQITLTTSAGVQNFAGAFSSLYVYGFGGNDIIRFVNNVTSTVMADAGDGNDQVFNAALGTGTILGGAGDDLLVSIGAGSATLRGGDGADSFWSDYANTIADASTAENAIGAVHRIQNFYQPYTSDTSSANYVPLTIAGQNFTDPTITSAATGYTNFANRPLFTNGTQYNDIVQGQIGDCYFLASLSALAQSNPQMLSQSITPLGDGTYAVRFYRSGQAVYLRIDGDLPTRNGSLAYANTSSTNEIWVPLLEKAFAHFRTNADSYASISGGWMADTLTMMTNQSTGYRSTSSSTASSLYSYLETQLTAGKAVTLGSYSSASGPIVGSHAYMVKSVQTTAQGLMVTVYNPWGIDGRAWDSNSGDGLLTISAAQVQQYFSAVVVG